jgi:hypothetical protein
MRRKVLFGFLGLVFVEVVIYLLGRSMAGRAAVGDEVSADFARTVVWNGDEFRSMAPALRSGVVRILGGGMVIDLRQAGLDPDGARLDLDVVLGGVSVVVRDDWRVTAEANTVLGGLAASVADEDVLPEHAPRLHIAARGRAGGISIRAKAL